MAGTGESARSFSECDSLVARQWPPGSMQAITQNPVDPSGQVPPATTRIIAPNLRVGLNFPLDGSSAATPAEAGAASDLLSVSTPGAAPVAKVRKKPGPKPGSKRKKRSKGK